MSLKTFHIVFISLSVLSLFGFGVWLAASGAVTEPGVQYVGAGLSFVTGMALAEYGRRFLRRYKKLSYM